MKGDSKVISLLNKALGIELVAINQYFLHARMYKNWGLEELDEADYDQSILKMKHADKLIERVLFLEGLPNLQDLGRLFIGEETTEMLKSNLDLEHRMREIFLELIQECEQLKDYISRDLGEGILKDIEKQIDWLESQHYLIDHAGLEDYLQSKMGDD
ncbi:bacterioferritin [Thalassomonas viridans]|uniref:Bacterioferritin n=1 Tax=Thalassomonas viridans TaxID=137584 RepID=A0AAE9Z5H9_9GAMM|nr:bacterioferritin [Thalassomonas viridans]WDE06440.1 bacterioferritin [Thalassomonas viridans]